MCFVPRFLICLLHLGRDQGIEMGMFSKRSLSLQRKQESVRFFYLYREPLTDEKV